MEDIKHCSVCNKQIKDFWVMATVKNKESIMCSDCATKILMQQNWNLQDENQNLKNEIIKECKEHQEAMLLADKRIKKLEIGWNKLKEYIEKHADNFDEAVSSVCFLMLDKMKDLEKEESNVKD